MLYRNSENQNMKSKANENGGNKQWNERQHGNGEKWLKENQKNEKA